MAAKDPKKVAAANARAKALPPQRLRDIGRTAALARWGVRAIHRGNFDKELGLDVDCYVLDDSGKTPVISQSGMARALGLSPRGNAFPRFLASQAMTKVAGAELKEKLENPLKFQWGTGGAEQPPATIHGYDAALLIDLCRAIIAAEAGGELPRRYSGVAQQAHIIVGASAKAGIKDFVYALAGYSPSADEVITAFKLYVQEEARKYEREFPNELYREWHRLYQIPVPERGKPWQFKHLTVKHIWYPLAKSNGKILELVRALKAKEGDRRNKLFQFLNDVGGRALSRHIGRVQEIAETSESPVEYEARINRRFGDQRELDFIAPPPSPHDMTPSRAAAPLPLFDRAPDASQQ